MAKRSMSDSDCEDLFSDTKDGCMTPPGSETCGHVSRKKRRGIIEKRRRDRINNSLTELRRLVPTAFEKQGSAKLEKAEILQMTVDHLKMLHAKGLDALAYDPHKFAMDYHSIGFRECAAEVARYLVTTEGMDIQDPIRLRLMSHLQCFAAQRELANKQASAASSWSINPLTPSPSYALQSHHHSLQHHSHLNSTNTGGLPAPASFQGIQHTGLMEATSPSQPHHQGSYLNTSTSHLHTSPSMPNESLLNHHHHHQQTSSGHHNIMNSTSPLSHQQRGSSSGYPPVAAYSMGMSHPGNGGNNNGGSSYVPNGKLPHRPWGGPGGELVY